MVEQQIPSRLWDESPLGDIISVAEAAIRALLLTPVAIAIDRLVILDEVTRAYTLPLGAPAHLARTARRRRRETSTPPAPS